MLEKLSFEHIFVYRQRLRHSIVQGDRVKKKVIFFAIILVFVFSVPKKTKPVFNEDGRDLLILMYHSVLRDPSRSGKYVITPEKVEEDLIFLKNRGYVFVTANQVVKYVHAGGELPKKSVLITFDDGMYNNLEYILPILEKHDAYAVFSVVGSFTDEYSAQDIKNPAYSYLRWCDIRDLQSTGRVEFGNHSYAFHSVSGARQGAAKSKSESELDYIESFYLDTQKMQSEFFANCNFYPFIYTYPFGSVSRESGRVLRKMGFLMTFSCTEGINRIERSADDLFLLKRFNRDGRLSSYEFFSQIKL